MKAVIQNREGSHNPNTADEFTTTYRTCRKNKLERYNFLNINACPWRLCGPTGQWGQRHKE